MDAKRAVEWLIIGGLFLAIVGPTAAQVMPSAGLQQISGKILSVDLGSRLLKIKYHALPGVGCDRTPSANALAPIPRPVWPRDPWPRDPER